MQSVSSRIWTRVAVSISYDDNDYTTGKYGKWSKACEVHLRKTLLTIITHLDNIIYCHRFSLNYTMNLLSSVDQSAGAVEYTDCTSAAG